MPILDWSATAAWLAIFATLAISIITPAVSTYLNNKFHLRLKELEIKQKNESELNSRKFAVYEGFLQNVGRFLHCKDAKNVSDVGTYLYELYLYLPIGYWLSLDTLIDLLNNQEWESAESVFITLSKALSDELKASDSSI